ncbi:MAG: hypothetical protein UT00_C0013G0021 [Parcubacteria group bacterium GW2011_GWA1_38_7]|nr:MAG: hypothetical protein UT00_C0013G0021 [Parcubacteria group bacterium GW2011_GWA1_38_7]
MPFKTRRQKESAIGRRVNFIASGLVTYRGAASVKSSKEKSAGDTRGGSLGTEESYGYVRVELVKIFILAIIIIGFQLALKASNVRIF